MDSSIPGAGGARIHVSFRTMCGREIQVGHLVLGGGRHPAQVPVAPPGEARRLATALLAQAAACDPRPQG